MSDMIKLFKDDSTYFTVDEDADITTTGDLSVNGTAEITGAITATGGVTGDVTGDLTAASTSILTDASGDLLLVQGTTVPTDATTGYAKGCLFIDTDVATGTSGLYVNVGTNTSCVFKLVSNGA